MDNLLLPFTLTLIAGLSTGIGTIIAVTKKKISNTFFATSLGFSAGIMVFISLTEMYPTTSETFNKLSLDNAHTVFYTTIFFLLGIIIIGLIDYFIPEIENPHEPKNMDLFNKNKEHQKQNNLKKYDPLRKTGILMALAIGLHNFPEGFATFVSSTQDLSVALSVVVAISLHNIPEGIAVAVPILFATNSRKKAFTYSMLSGLAEPIGGLLGYLCLKSFNSELILGISFAIVAGIMVFIAIDELLPSAEEHGKHHHAIWGFVIGMIVIALSINFLEFIQ